jgi:hypothetical protein
MEQAIVAPMRLGFKRQGSTEAGFNRFNRGRVQESSTEAGFRSLRFKPAVRQKKSQ